MNNYLLPILETYFSEILVQESRMKISHSFLNTRRDEIEKENRRHRSLYSAITSYRDLTKLDGGDNLYCPNHHFEMTIDDAESHINNIVSQQCCFAIAQGYEAFERFLIEIVTEFLVVNQNRLSEVNMASGNILLLRDTVRGFVKNRQETNNKGLFSIVRKLSTHFGAFENNNIHSTNICQWFDLLAMVRHIIVHNHQIISVRFLKYLETRNAGKMFERHFRRKQIDGQIRVFLEPNMADDILNWLNSFAHFIFVSLSKEAGLSLYVSSYIPPPLPHFRTRHPYKTKKPSEESFKSIT